jgi:2-hydroxycyclohexanecarboxyl-CoA dehydrogenase
MAGETGERPRPILVTGAGSGIGRCTAETLAGRGHPVAVCDKDEAGARETVAGIRERGGAGHAVFVDVTEPASIRTAVAESLAHLGGLGGLVNNVGWTIHAPLDEHDDALVDTLLQVNLTGAIRMAREVVPALRERGDGRIVNVASDAARSGLSNAVAYTAAKGGVLALTRSLARELARHDITVNTVSPGVVATPLLTSSMERTPDMLDKLRRSIPLRRLGSPADVAGAIAYFCGPDAGYVTGQTLSVNGGLVIT